MIQCNAHKCYACEKRFDLISRETEWTCPPTQQRYKIRPYSCNHRFVIYVVYCTKCGHYILMQQSCSNRNHSNNSRENQHNSNQKAYFHDCSLMRNVDVKSKR